MKKIKITNKQAALLGIKKLNENDESGIKASGLSMGDLVVRVVIEGDSVAANKDRILYLVTRQDPDATIGFFEATGKIVGNVKSIKLDAIARDLKGLDPNIIIKKKTQAKALKEGVKNTIKITKEQYNRIFASGLINESDEVKGGINRVDKTFKKEFAGKDIQDLKSVAENDFDVKKPVSGIPDSKMKNTKPAKVEEQENPDDQFKNEVIELIKYLYRKSDKLSPFWKSKGISYEAICDTLISKGLILGKDGKYVLSRSAGSPDAAIQAIVDQLRILIPNQSSQPVEVDEDNYPAGAANDSKAPYNQKDADTVQSTAKAIKLEPVAYNGELILFKDPQGDLYAYYHWKLDKDQWLPYASVSRHFVGKGEDGPEYDYDYDAAEKTIDAVSHYVNDNLDSLSKGEGIEAWESDVDLVKIDEPLKQELLSLFDKDKSIVNVLGPIAEASWEDSLSSFKDNLVQAHTPKQPTGETPEAKQSRIVSKLQSLKDKENQRRDKEQLDIDARRNNADNMDEMTGSASSGAFVAPLGMANDDKVVKETTTTVNTGNYQYDAPALANVGRNGEYKKGPKTKAEKTPQWAGGEFVEQPECSKPNNNKEAQKGGCNSGASSLKTKKVKGSINAPSIGESEIYETIAKQTGKTIDEVKRIIESKRVKQ